MSSIDSSITPSPGTQHLNPGQVVLRSPERSDAHAVHGLIQQCPPLDLNSVYTYLLLSEHFADTCLVALRGGQLDGFVSAYLPPQKTDVLFVWQVAVHQRARGLGLGGHLLRSLLARPAARQARYVETTVGPDNASSRRMFQGLAGHLNAPMHESLLFDRSLFGPSAHEDERLIRIGPF
ncbi:diaminobutyrate acetyltransferase [Eoetvoesia caeni]|nr:diaminobutyrate acetyltransferase [Eoetvoesiella caeni]